MYFQKELSYDSLLGEFLMEMGAVFQTITLIGMFIVIGALLARTFPFNDDTRSLFINLIVNAAIPAIILSSIFNVEMTPERFRLIALVFVISIVINLFGMGLGYLFSLTFYRQAENKNELAILSGLGNTGFIGIPLCAVLFGAEGALYAAIFDAGVDFTIWTFGVFLLQKEKKFHFGMLKEMINIPMIAIVLGLTAAFFHVKPPVIFIELFDYLAALAAPLAMFYIGTIIMNISRSRVTSATRQMWIPILVKLFIVPISVAFFVLYIQAELVVIQTILIQSMMPTITLASILFAKFSADEEMGAMTTVVSTLIALLTIPLMIYIVNIIVPM